jgi:hypothetical protein
MNKWSRILLFGFLSWLLPFAFSFLFYSRQGTPLLDRLVVHNILMVFGGLVAVYLLIRYFKTVKKDFVKEGVTVGIVWLTINLVLDLVILVPMAKMPLGTYFGQIGLGYLMIPIISIGIGYVAKR